MSFVSFHVREPRTVLDPGFHALDSGFQVLDSSICQWNLDSGFQSFVGFRIPWAVFSDSKTQDSGFHKQNFPGFSYMGRIVRLRFSLYWIKIVHGRRITCLPERHWACQLFLHFVTKLGEPFTWEKNVGSARRMTHLARSPFLIGKFTLLAGPTFLHINTLAGLPSPILNSNSNRLICRKGRSP